MIEIKDLTKRFDGFTALQELNMTVPQASVYGLVGPNGAGKSTIIRHLTGVYYPDSGTVLVGGQPVFENPAVKSRIACIPDDLSCHAGSTIHELRQFYKGLYPNFSDARFDALRDIFPLDVKQPLRRFSKGMQKQAAFWLAISTQPDYLILDEPVDGLDPVMRKQVWSVILEDVASRGTTVLVSSHNLRELEDVCDHVGVLHEGRMLLERSLSDLQENIVKVQLVTDRWCSALYSVPDEIPQISQISAMLCAFASYSFKAFSIVFASFGGLPPLRPLALAEVKPSFVRCTVKSRSNWHRAERTVTSSLPVGVLMSMLSFRLISTTPCFSKCSTSASKSFVERPNLDRLSITTVSPLRSLSSSLSNSGLLRFVPVIFSVSSSSTP